MMSAQNKDVKIIVLLGQSNMEGHSWTDYLDRHFAPELVKRYTSPSKVVIAYNCDDGCNTSGAEFVPVQCGQGFDETRFGPEVSIAAYLEDKGRSDEFKIIKYAIGGTSLHLFWRSPSSGGPGYCYANAVNYIHVMLNKLKNEGYNPILSAILFMQGEDDAANATHFAYEKLLLNFISDLRAEFKEFAPEEGIYFIDALISDSPLWIHYNEVNEAKIKVAQSDYHNIVIDTLAAGLSYDKEPDFIIDYAHYDSVGTIKLGELFASALIDVIE